MSQYPGITLRGGRIVGWCGLPANEFQKNIELYSTTNYRTPLIEKGGAEAADVMIDIAMSVDRLDGSIYSLDDEEYIGVEKAIHRIAEYGGERSLPPTPPEIVIVHESTAQSIRNDIITVAVLFVCGLVGYYTGMTVTTLLVAAVAGLLGVIYTISPPYKVSMTIPEARAKLAMIEKKYRDLG